MGYRTYSKTFKEKVVQFYHDHPGLGYLSVAREFQIPSPETVRKWIKEKEAKGEQAFSNKRKKRSSNKSEIKKQTAPVSTGSWTDPKDKDERIAFLEAENAYLKKLMALRKGEDDR